MHAAPPPARRAAPAQSSLAFASPGSYPPTHRPLSAAAIIDGEVKQVSLSDYKGKYVILFFYPKDFT